MTANDPDDRPVSSGHYSATTPALADNRGQTVLTGEEESSV
ncbi:hypothetical protein [Streptomyces sp. NPDC058683]